MSSKKRESLVKQSPLQAYLREISKYPLLSAEEELKYAKQHLEDGDVKAAHRLVTANLRLVVRIANEFKQIHLNILDIIQEGNTGLMRAVQRYNPYKGAKLSSYAAWWIRAYILRYIIDNKSQVKMGTTAAQRKLFYNLEKAKKKLLLDLGEATPKQLAEELNVKEKEVVEMQSRLAVADMSLDTPVGGEEGNDTYGSMMSGDEDSIDDEIATNEIKNIFSEYIVEFRKTLSERDLIVFNERIMAETPKTLQEIGNKFNFSRERARQLEARIIKNLRKYVEDQGNIIDI